MVPRQYSDEQLAEIARPFEEHAIAALRAGDLTRVRELVGKMTRGQSGLDTMSVHTLARKVGKLRQDFGEEKARAAVARIGAQLMQTWVREIGAGEEREAIAALLAIYKHQGGARLAARETDDEVVVELAPCGSGGRLQRQGMTEKHPQWYAGWSDGIPSFCQLCKACQGALNEGIGYSLWSTEIQPEGHCRMRFQKQKGRGGRLFTDAQLNEVVKTRTQRITEKLDAGDLDIEPLLRGQRKDWMPWHDFGVVCLAYFYNVAIEFGGADYLDEVLMQTYAPAFTVGFPHYQSLSDDQLLHEIACTWNYHCADFSIREEDDRFVFVLDPCGSGGRLLRGQMWRDMYHYGEPLSAKMGAPHNINFNRSNAPTYCTHCAASNRAQLLGGPLFFVVDGHAQREAGQACRQFSFKKGAGRHGLQVLRDQIGLPAVAAETDAAAGGDAYQGKENR